VLDRIDTRVGRCEGADPRLGMDGQATAHAVHCGDYLPHH
jgi:hypothetical protein